MARVTVNGRPLTVREAIFLATSGAVSKIPGETALPDTEAMTTDEVRAVVDLLGASRSRDLNLDTARTRARAELDFREKHGY